MPLRVLLDDADVIAPLPEAEWESLCQRVRSKEITLRLPCCKGTGYPRLSPLGLQHFAHHHNNGCEPETEEHIAAKIQIVEACRAAGLHAIPEHIGNGWRADVFVKARAWEACFEVQYSAQSFQETIRRQHIYRDSGVRCCWLFGNLPKRQTVPEDQRRLSSQQATPMFELRRTSDPYLSKEITFAVDVNGTRRPLRRFVHDLLSKRLRYCRSLVSSPVSATVRIWKVKCSNCWRSFRFFYVSEVHGRTQCGAEINLEHHRFSKLYPQAYEPFFTQFLKTFPGGMLAFSARQHESLQCYEFACQGCGEMAFTEKPPSKTRGLRNMWDSKVQTRLLADHHIYLSHWCDNPRCTPCTGEPSEIQDLLARPELEWDPVPEKRFNY